ncbi:MAG: BatA domain-containing protein [Trueperaceae bacterium]
MTFAAPAYLWLLSALPLVIALHYLRARRRRHDVSALFLWRKARQTVARRRRFSPTWLLVAQLAFTALAALALAQPRIATTALPDRVLLLDVSASMAASAGTAGAADTTRLDLARAAAKDLLAGAGRVAIVRVGVEPRVVAPLDAAADERAAAIDAVVPGDAQADLSRALDLAAALLPGAEIHLFTDQEIDLGRVQVHRFGNDVENVGIAAFDVAIDQAFVSLVASGSRPREVEVRLLHEDAEIARGTVLVPSDGAGSITFPLTDVVGVIEARLSVPDGDALALDDRAFAGSRPLTIVTDDAHGPLLRALEAMPNAETSLVRAAALLAADLHVLSRANAEGLPPGRYLMFAPPAEAPDYRVVKDWDRAHDLLRFVDLRDTVVGLDPTREAWEEEGWLVLARTADLTPVLRLREDEDFWILQAAFHTSQTDLVLRPAFPALIANVVAAMEPTERIRLGETAATGDTGPVLVPGVHALDGTVVLASLFSSAESRLPRSGSIYGGVAGLSAGRIGVPAGNGAAAEGSVDGAGDGVDAVGAAGSGANAPASAAGAAGGGENGAPPPRERATPIAWALLALALLALTAEWLLFGGIIGRRTAARSVVG